MSFQCLFQSALLIWIWFLSAAAFAAGTQGFGIDVGVGTPYLQQTGIHYHFNERFAISAGYNLLDLSIGGATVKLSMPEVLVSWHPFGGAYYLGLGLGSENLKTSAKDATSTLEASVEVTASTTIVKTGWMWGLDNGGFWFGMDLSYIKPSGSSVTLTAPGVATTDQVYIDALDAANKFGEVAYTNITFARFGWLF